MKFILFCIFLAANTAWAGDEIFFVFVNRSFSSDFARKRKEALQNPIVESKSLQVWRITSPLNVRSEPGLRVETLESLDRLISKKPAWVPYQEALIALKTGGFFDRLDAATILSSQSITIVWDKDEQEAINNALQNVLEELSELSRERFEQTDLTPEWRERLYSVEEVYFSFLLQSQTDPVKIYDNFLLAFLVSKEIVLKWVSDPLRSRTLLYALNIAFKTFPERKIFSFRLLTHALFQIGNPNKEIQKSTVDFLENFVKKIAQNPNYYEIGEEFLFEVARPFLWKRLPDLVTETDVTTSHLSTVAPLSDFLIMESSLKLLRTFLENPHPIYHKDLLTTATQLLKRVKPDDFEKERQEINDQLSAIFPKTCGGPNGVL